MVGYPPPKKLTSGVPEGVLVGVPVAEPASQTPASGQPLPVSGATATSMPVQVRWSARGCLYDALLPRRVRD